jgi:uroporphyrinogen-III synthase
LLFPLLDIAAVQNSRELQEQISRLAQFDLAIFISPNAVKYGIAAIQDVVSGASNEIDLPPALKIATVGQGSAKALRELGISNVIAPTERFDSEGLLALPQLQNVAGWRVMIFRGDGGRELLGDTLKARGATVEYAACYRRSKSQQDAGALIAAMPDAITVTSSEALGYLRDLLDESSRARLAAVPLFVPHARIAELACQLGWQHVKSMSSGDDGMVAALVEWAEKKGST